MSKPAPAGTVHELLTKRIPPHSLEAERAVLGAILLDGPTLAKAVGFLKPSDFYKEGHRQIFNAMIRLFERNEPADLLTVSEELKRRNELDEVGGPAALAGLVEEAATAAHFLSYGAIVREKAVLRELIHVGTEIIGQSYDGAAGRDLLTAATTRMQGLGERLECGVQLLGVGLGEFLGEKFEAAEPYVEGILNSESSGWIAGEEKLYKSLYATHEGVSLALGHPVAGRFPVPEQRRVLFIEEEDPPRRVWARVRALLRGLDLDPDNSETRAELSAWFRIAVWSGFSLDEPQQVARLDATLEAFPADVVYLDVLRKLTGRDLNKAPEAGALLGVLDEIRRRRGTVFRVLHHYRKTQGFRVGRGSQEMGGSFALGAWGEASLFFEPIGRKEGAVRVAVQTKDGAPIPGFRLVIHGDGRQDAPESLALVAEDLGEDTSLDDQLAQAVAALEKTEAMVGKPGVAVAALSAALKKSDKSIRRGLKRLQDGGRVLVVGQASKGVLLYGVIGE